MDMKKKEYTKPSIRLVEWEFNDAICQKIYNASLCIKIETESYINHVENRNTSSGTWTRVGRTQN